MPCIAKGVVPEEPHLTGAKGGAGTRDRQTDALLAWFSALSDRLRHTKVCCGSWEHVVTKASTYGQGLTAVFLDPPYDAGDAMPDSWDCVAWKAAGGYGNQREDNDNAGRERIWFSPHCLQPQAELFAMSEMIA